VRIAITGHSAGIGEALAKIYADKGHEIIGLSRRNGYNIRSTPKVAAMIEPCDMFINNAQVGFAQTELLFDVWNRWQGQNKTIMVISSMMASLPMPYPLELHEYYIQKKTLEEACRQLSYKSTFPKLVVVKPGAIATQPSQIVRDCADLNRWAETLVNCFDMTDPDLFISEIALGPKYRGS
jgi:hypothetical protein